MKPVFSAEPPRRLARHDHTRARHDPLPAISHRYQPPRDGGFYYGDGEPKRRTSFSLLTDQVLREDASRSFRLESAVLALVSLVSAWPIAVMIHEVIKLLK